MSRVETIGDATLYLGDCREILPTLGRFDAMVTDPPYGVNLGTHLASKDRRKDRVLVKDGYEGYDDSPENFVNVVAPAIRAGLACSDRALVFVAAKTAWSLPPPDAMGGVYLPAGCGRNAWGFSTLAHCLLYGQAPSLELGAKATAIRSSAMAEKIDHPCPKPLSWMLWAISLSTVIGHHVIDPFMGSGTTGIACHRMGRSFTGIEVEPKYFDLACRRIDEAQKQDDLFIPKKIKDRTLSLAF